MSLLEKGKVSSKDFANSFWHSTSRYWMPRLPMVRCFWKHEANERIARGEWQRKYSDLFEERV